MQRTWVGVRAPGFQGSTGSPERPSSSERRIRTERLTLRFGNVESTFGQSITESNSFCGEILRKFCQIKQFLDKNRKFSKKNGYFFFKLFFVNLRDQSLKWKASKLSKNCHKISKFFDEISYIYRSFSNSLKKFDKFIRIFRNSYKELQKNFPFF